MSGLPEGFATSRRVGPAAEMWHPSFIKKAPGLQSRGFQVSQAVVTPDRVNTDGSVIAVTPGLVQEDQISDSAVGPFVGRRPQQRKERTHQGHSCGSRALPCNEGERDRCSASPERASEAPSWCQRCGEASARHRRGVRVRSTLDRARPQGLGRAPTRRSGAEPPGLVFTP